MRTLIVYYSFEGSTKLMADTMATAIGADILSIMPKKEIATHGFMKFVWGGRQAMMKAKPEILPLDKNVLDYDLIIIGTPVWAWTFTPPIRTFFDKVKFTDKKVAVFCCHGGDMRKTLEEMKTALAGNEIVGEIDFKEPAKNNTEENIKRASDWAKQLI